MRVTGTFSQPRIAIDAEALLKSRLQGGLTDFLKKTLGKPSAEEGAAPAEEEEDNPARDLLDIFIPRSEPAPKPESAPAPQGASEPAAEPSPAAQTEPAPAPAPAQEEAASPEEVLLNEGLNRLFGRKPAPAEAEPAEEAAQEPANEPQP
jgi:hypothetical protein